MEAGLDLDLYVENARTFTEEIIERTGSVRKAINEINKTVESRLKRLGWTEELGTEVSRSSLNLWQDLRQEISYQNLFCIGVYKGYPPHLAAYMARCDFYGIPYKIPQNELFTSDRLAVLQQLARGAKEIAGELEAVVEASAVSTKSVKTFDSSKNHQKVLAGSAIALNSEGKDSGKIGVLEKESGKMPGAIGKLIREEMAVRGLDYRNTDDMERFLSLLPSNRYGIAFSVAQVVTGSLPAASREIMADIAFALKNLTGSKKYTAAFLERLQDSSSACH